MAQYIEDFLPPIQSAGLNTLENVSIGGTLAVTGNATFSGSVAGLVPVVTASSATTLTVAQSGSTVVYNSTTGVLVTLPAPTAGLQYDFVVAKTPASASHGIITNAGTVFLAGGITIVPSAGGTSATFVADGTTHIAMRMNGTTTGGSVPTQFRATCISSTQWMITGQTSGSGALATPFNTV